MDGFYNKAEKLDYSVWKIKERKSPGMVKLGRHFMECQLSEMIYVIWIDGLEWGADGQKPLNYTYRQLARGSNIPPLRHAG